MWWKKNKWKVIVPVILLAVLAGAFWFGGDSPGSRGWKISKTDPSAQTQEASGAVSAAQQTETSENSQQNAPAENKENASEQNAPAQQSADAAKEQESGKTQETPAGNTTKEPEAEQPSEGGTPQATPENQQPEPSKEPEKAPEKEPEPQPQAQQPETQAEPQPETQTGTQTEPQPEEPKETTCTISISCATILDNMSWCPPAKVGLVPADGWILPPTEVVFNEGESVFNVLSRICKKNKIHMEFSNNPLYDSAYIEGINNIYQFDVGELSGWMYSVNGWFPNFGCSKYILNDGDVICWVYTCDLGNDVGGGYAVQGG